MKKYIYHKFGKPYRRGGFHRHRPFWPGGLRYLAALAIVFGLILGGLATWGAILTIKSVAGSVNPAVIQESMAKGEEKIRAMAERPVTTRECLDNVGTILTPARLLTVPLAQNIEMVRTACWEKAKDQENQKKQS